MKLPENTTWNDILDRNDIILLEDPVFSTGLSKQKYYQSYGKVLDEFNGNYQDCYMDLYFQIDPVQAFLLRFIDSSCRKDFFDFAVELGISDDLQEIHKSETHKNEKQRKLKKKESN